MMHLNISCFFSILPLPVPTAVCVCSAGLAPELTSHFPYRVRGICHQVCGCSSQGEQSRCFSGVLHLTRTFEVQNYWNPG